MIDLVTFITGLREQLEIARQNSQKAAEDGNGIMFAVNKTEVELSVAVTQEASASGKLKFNVLGFGAELGGEGGMTHQGIQKLKLELDTIDVSTGGKLLISKAGADMPDLDD